MALKKDLIPIQKDADDLKMRGILRPDAITYAERLPLNTLQLRQQPGAGESPVAQYGILRNAQHGGGFFHA